MECRIYPSQMIQALQEHKRQALKISLLTAHTILVEGESRRGIIFILPMRFEFDPGKSKRNKEKHGIDFVEAQRLWEDENRLEIEARSDDEPRLALIALTEGKLWSAFFTYRGEQRIRLISVRRAREKEEQLYYEG